MSVNIYMNFNGNCREAVGFYAKVFNVEMQKMLTFGDVNNDTASQITDETTDLIMHTFLEIGGSKVMFSDVLPGMPFVPGNNITLTYTSRDIDDVKGVFSRISDGGNIDMEIQETFWSKCYGSCTDKYGVNWQCNCE